MLQTLVGDSYRCALERQNDYTVKHIHCTFFVAGRTIESCTFFFQLQLSCYIPFELFKFRCIF